jgi:hypothetical protein
MSLRSILNAVARGIGDAKAVSKCPRAASGVPT